MTPEVALEYINAAKHSAYVLEGQPTGGDFANAYKVKNTDGAEAILKISNNPMWRAQIERAKAATDHLRPLGYPVPQYLYVDANNTGTFWLESPLPGQTVEQPTPEQTTDLLRLLEMHKGQAISELQGQDWSWYAAGVVFRGDAGLVRILMQFSTATSALAAQIEGLVLGLDSKALGNADLVHGNYTINQVFMQSQMVSGVLDWDQVGYGNRAMDLVSLWYSLMNVPAARDQVFATLQTVADAETIKIFAAYKMLTVIAASIHKSGGEVETDIQQVKAALQILA